MKSIRLITLFLLISSFSFAQIVTIDPAFPQRDELVTITYDATQGSTGLVGESQVYMHTGLITNTSTSPSDWKFVVGNWGTDDSRVKMTNIGGDKHQLSYIIDDFYEVPSNIEVEKLAFVFRNIDGSKEGKTTTGGDIFLDFNSTGSYATQLISPTSASIITEIGNTITIKFSASEISDIRVIDNDVVIHVEETNYLEYSYEVITNETHQIVIESTFDGEVQAESFTAIVNPDVIIEELPDGSKFGINPINTTDYRLVLLAPGKSNAYVIGDFNNWEVNTDYFMKRSPDGQTFWIDLIGLEVDKNYSFQYLIDGTIQVADPFSELVLDPNNDQWISDNTFPDMHPYPSNLTNGYVSLLKTEAIDYEWQNDFTAPAEEDLVIYELLMRDFSEEKNYQTLLDTLDYLDRLGINAIEFMPVNEFEGNQSWGYNPSFHMALDKYYGTPESFKILIDECHARGIAVILDVVYNHAFSQSPLAQMYWDAANFRPSEDSPFLNVTARHPYNVGYDFNHESIATQTFVKRVVQYWLEEYNVDGFRFDLSKGFTQKMSTNDSQFRAYDQNRIDILKQYADDIWEVNSDAYVILEHFAANAEEKALSQYGMMLWSNHNYNFNEGTMGYNTGGKSNFEWIDYKKKGWDAPLAVGYMESHDEERLMYKNLEFGNSASGYSVKELETALERIELASAFFYAVPGPKMLWQFGEVGFDFSINRCENGTISEDCRLSPKPIRWDYKEDINRKKLLDVVSAMIKLKTTTDITNTNNYSHNLGPAGKYIKLNSDDTNVLIVGNFDVADLTMNPGFSHTGTWYEYFSQDSIEVTSTTQTINLSPGQYLVYSDQKLDNGLTSGIEDLHGTIEDYKLYPNPAINFTEIAITLNKSSKIIANIYNQSGQMVSEFATIMNAGENTYNLETGNLDAGLYHLAITGSDFRIVDRLLIIK